MGEKHLEVIVLLLADAADVDVRAHLHNNRMTWWEGEETQITHSSIQQEIPRPAPEIWKQMTI